MKEKSEYPFTVEQFNKLTEEERGAVLAVAEYLTGNTVGISDEELSSALNLMKESEGCVPQEEVDGDPWHRFAENLRQRIKRRWRWPKRSCGNRD